MTATPDELDRRASRCSGWRAAVLKKLAKEARAYRPEVEIELKARRA